MYICMHIYICMYTYIYKHIYTRPVGWGCRIRRLHFCRGVRPPPNEATCWLWVATRKALGWNPGG